MLTDVLPLMMKLCCVWSQVSGEGSATIPLVPPRLEDTGEYTCRAENEIGEDVSVITVNVMGQWCHAIVSVVSCNVSVVSCNVSVVSCNMSVVSCSRVSGVMQSCQWHHAMCQWCHAVVSVVSCSHVNGVMQSCQWCHAICQ